MFFLTFIPNRTAALPRNTEILHKRWCGWREESQVILTRYPILLLLLFLPHCMTMEETRPVVINHWV